MMDRRTFFKEIVGVVIGAIVSSAAIAKVKKEKRVPPEWKAYHGGWLDYPDYVRRRILDACLPSITHVNHCVNNYWDLAYFHCINKEHMITGAFAISRKEFERNNPVQRCRLVIVKIGNMLRTNRELRTKEEE